MADQVTKLSASVFAMGLQSPVYKRLRGILGSVCFALTLAAGIACSKAPDPQVQLNAQGHAKAEVVSASDDTYTYPFAQLPHSYENHSSDQGEVERFARGQLFYSRRPWILLKRSFGDVLAIRCHGVEDLAEIRKLDVIAKTVVMANGVASVMAFENAEPGLLGLLLGKWKCENLDLSLEYYNRYDMAIRKYKVDHTGVLVTLPVGIKALSCADLNDLEFIKPSAHLQSLRLRELRYSEMKVEACADWLGACTRLRELEAHERLKPDPSILAALVPLFQRVSSLHRLHIRLTAHVPELTTVVTNLVSRCRKSLRVLHVEMPPDTALPPLVRVLPDNLESLALGGSSTSLGEALPALGRHLNSATNGRKLQHLSLFSDSPEPYNLFDIAQGLQLPAQGLAEIESLSLRGNLAPPDEVALRELFPALRGFAMKSESTSWEGVMEGFAAASDRPLLFLYLDVPSLSPSTQAALARMSSLRFVYLDAKALEEGMLARILRFPGLEALEVITDGGFPTLFSQERLHHGQFVNERLRTLAIFSGTGTQQVHWEGITRVYPYLWCLIIPSELDTIALRGLTQGPGKVEVLHANFILDGQGGYASDSEVRELCRAMDIECFSFFPVEGSKYGEFEAAVQLVRDFDGGILLVVPAFP